MMEEAYKNPDGQVSAHQCDIGLRLSMQQFPGLALSERRYHHLVIEQILRISRRPSFYSERLRAAVASDSTGSTRATRNEIRDQIWAHFLGRERKFRPRPQKDSYSHHIIDGGPASKVFGTTELLEEILKHVSTVDLVTVSRTNKMFHTVMTTSPCLQPKLFLRPTRPTATLDVLHKRSTGDFNHRHTIAELNPLLRLKDTKPETLLSRLNTNRCSTNGISPNGPWETVVFTDRAVFAGCWTNMYLTNPPCTEIIVDMKHTGYSIAGFSKGNHNNLKIRNEYSTFRMYRAEGITFAMLIEAVYLKRGVKYPELNFRLSCSRFWGLHPGSPVPAADGEVLNWLKTNNEVKRRVLDLSGTYIDLVRIALPFTEDMQQMELIREKNCDKQTGMNVAEEPHSEDGNAITRFEMTIEEN